MKNIKNLELDIDDYKEMIAFIEQNSGKKLDYDRLEEVLIEINKQDSLTADMEDMLMLVPTPIPPIYNVMLYAARFCFSGHPEYTKLLEIMVETSKKRAADGVPGSRSSGVPVHGGGQWEPVEAERGEGPAGAPCVPDALS